MLPEALAFAALAVAFERKAGRHYKRSTKIPLQKIKAETSTIFRIDIVAKFIINNSKFIIKQPLFSQKLEISTSVFGFATIGIVAGNGFIWPITYNYKTSLRHTMLSF